MKKLAIVFTFFLIILLAGCNQATIEEPDLNITTTETPVTEELLESDFTIENWNNLTLSTNYFASLKKGDKIVIRVSPLKNDYVRVYLESKDWQNYYFSNIKCSPEPDSYEKEENGIKYNRLSLNSNENEYVITIVFSQSEADKLREGGFMFTGANYIIKSVKLSYTKVEISSEYTLEEQYELFSEKRNAEIEKYSEKYKTPMIFITTQDRQPVRKKEYYDAIIDVVNCDEEFVLSKKGKVKVRGNSTADDRWSPDIKPYRIKFDKKQNMLGLHNGKKYRSWVLLKAENFYAADYLGFNLAHEIYKTSDFDYYASDCTFVHVFINDVYQAVYLLCEQNQVNEGRVAVNENVEKSKDVKTGYMLELDNYAWDDLKDGQGRWFDDGCSQGKEDYHFTIKYLSENPDDMLTFEVWGNKQQGVKLTDVNGVTRGVMSDDFTLKNDIYDDEQVKFIKKYTGNLWELCYQAIEKNKFYKFDENYDLIEAPEFKSAKDVCDAVVDLESLCNEIILEEIVRDFDVGAGSLYMAIDFTKAPGEKYSKFTFECPWDFNWGYSPVENDGDGGAFWDGKLQYFAGAWQNTTTNEDGYDRSHPWFILFNNAPWFRKMLREKWDEIGTENLRAVVKEAEKTVKDCGKDVGGSSCWIADYVYNRISYIDENLF